MRSRLPQRGFTLIELLVAVAIAGIVAAYAYANYSGSVRKSNRSAAESLLLRVSTEQEKYLLEARAYAPDLTTLGVTAPAEVSSLYTVSVTANNAATPPSYTVSATPIAGKAASQDPCGTLSYDSTGTKGVSGSTVASCW